MQQPAFWQIRGFLSTLLAPLSWLYYLGMCCDLMIKKRRFYRPNIPVISVGNLRLGGSGKTPLVAAIAHHLTQQGEVVAILTRGYGAHNKGSQQVNASHRAKDIGDEPYMLHHMGVAQQVWVGANRVLSAVQAQSAGATVIILDDGFQHWRLGRDLDIVAIGALGFGNACILPAGPLREPISALKRADIVVQTGGDQQEPMAQYHLSRHLEKPEITHSHVIAFCGLADPDQFFNGLRALDIHLTKTYTFNDHADYTDAHLTPVFSTWPDATILTTWKDYVKLAPQWQEKCTPVTMTLTGCGPLLKEINEKYKQAI